MMTMMVMMVHGGDCGMLMMLMWEWLTFVMRGRGDFPCLASPCATHRITPPNKQTTADSNNPT